MTKGETIHLPRFSFISFHSLSFFFLSIALQITPEQQFEREKNESKWFAFLIVVCSFFFLFLESHTLTLDFVPIHTESIHYYSYINRTLNDATWKWKSTLFCTKSVHLITSSKRYFLLSIVYKIICYCGLAIQGTTSESNAYECKKWNQIF